MSSCSYPFLIISQPWKADNQSCSYNGFAFSDKKARNDSQSFNVHKFRRFSAENHMFTNNRIFEAVSGTDLSRSVVRLSTPATNADTKDIYDEERRMLEATISKKRSLRKHYSEKVTLKKIQRILTVCNASYGQFSCRNSMLQNNKNVINKLKQKLRSDIKQQHPIVPDKQRIMKRRLVLRSATYTRPKQFKLLVTNCTNESMR